MIIKIESLKKYVGIIPEKQFMELATKVYMLADFICVDYPEYKKWYFTKQLPVTVNSNERNILFVRNPGDDNEIISIAFLKKDDDEKKICTLYVSYKYRGLGIGKAIVEESMRWLETTKPLITFADYKLEMFKPFIDRYGWELTEIVSGVYNDNSLELCFNGLLTKKIMRH